MPFGDTCFVFYSYLKEFGFTIPDRPIVVDDIRVRGCGKSGIRSVYKSQTGHKQAKPVTVHLPERSLILPHVNVL